MPNQIQISKDRLEALALFATEIVQEKSPIQHISLIKQMRERYGPSLYEAHVGAIKARDEDLINLTDEGYII